MNPVKGLNIGQKALKALLLVGLFGVSATGSFLALDYSRRDENHNYEAVVIDGDTNFAASVDYTLNINPGGEDIQQIEVKSLLGSPVTCNYAFRGTAGVDYSMFDLEITQGDFVVDHVNLHEAIYSQNSYSFRMTSQETQTISFKYAMDFGYRGDNRGWDFQIVFHAEGRIM